MSSEIDDTLANSLGIVPISEVVTDATSVIVADTPDRGADDLKRVEDDYEYARRNMRDLIALGMTVAQSAADAAQGAQDANTYASVAQVIKSMAEANKQLMNLSEQKVKLTGLSTPKDTSGGSVTNNLFVGSTAELQQLLSNRNKDE